MVIIRLYKLATLFIVAWLVTGIFDLILLAWLVLPCLWLLLLDELELPGLTLLLLPRLPVLVDVPPRFEGLVFLLVPPRWRPLLVLSGEFLLLFDCVELAILDSLLELTLTVLDVVAGLPRLEAPENELLLLYELL